MRQRSTRFKLTRLVLSTSLALAALSAQAYQVISVSSGLNVDLAGANPAAGAAIIQWTKNNAPNQDWTIFPVQTGADTYYKIISNSTGKNGVIDVQNASKANSALIIQNANSNNDSQLWKLIARNNGFDIVNKNSGQCLDVTQNSTNAGTQLNQYPCTGSANQRWTIPDFTATAPTPAQVTAQIIKANSSGLVLDVDQGNNHVNQWSANNGANQQWKLMPEGTNFKIVSAIDNSRVLDVTAGTDPWGNARSVTVLNAASASGSPTQKWRITDKGNGAMEIANGNGQCLDVPGNSTTAGVQFNLYACNGQANQRFTLAAVGSVPAVNAPGPVAVPPVVANPSGASKRGAGGWDHANSDKALKDANLAWYYNWGVDRTSGLPASTEFVPMMWGAGDVTDANIAKAKANGNGWLLAFNEPDGAGDGYQSNVGVQQACDLWPKLVASGLKLGAPAAASNMDDNFLTYSQDTQRNILAGSWLGKFMNCLAGKGLQDTVKAIPVHIYPSQINDVPAAIDTLRKQMANYHAAFPNQEIWLTEFKLMRYNWDYTNQQWDYPSVDQEVAFVKEAKKLLDSLPYVKRYAWFALWLYQQPGTNFRNDTGALYNEDGTITPVGNAYKN